MKDITLIEAENLSARANIVHAFLGRTGGVSPPPFDTLNVSHRVGDSPENIEANLRIIAERLGFSVRWLVIANQTHGNTVVHIRRRSMCGVGRYSADALVTGLRGVALCVLTADCVPLIVADPEGGVVSIIHAGWRGTLKRIVQKTVSVMRSLYGVNPDTLVCAIGPAIGGCCYTVDHTLLREFKNAFPEAPGIEHRRGSLDLRLINRWLLEREGLKDIEMVDICTACSVDSFFSYRKEKTTGRQLNMVMLKG